MIASPGIRALVMDFDGVHTDDRVTVGVDGDEYVTCSRSDGMGVEMLRKRGFHLLILSKEVSSVVAARARKLKVDVRHGIDDKLPEMKQWLAEKGVSLAEACYVGNDINDADCLRAAGLAVVPAGRACRRRPPRRRRHAQARRTGGAAGSGGAPPGACAARSGPIRARGARCSRRRRDVGAIRWPDPNGRRSGRE